MTASRYSKTVILGISIVVLALVALTIARVAQAADPPGINLPTAPVTATFVENFTPPGGTSYFTTTLSSVPPGYDVGNSEYIAWCVDPYSGPPPATNTTGPVTLYSTYGTTLPANVNGSVVPWDKINYLLNHKNGQPNNVIQPAIWFLISGDRDAWNPPNPPWSCPVASACDALVVDANANGVNFVPGPGQVVAVFMYNNGISFNPIVDDGWQDTIMEVPVLPYDLGDLPDTSGGTGSGNYQTLFADNGPNHLMTNNLYLGACVDNETNGQPNTAATGDNSSLLGLPVVTYGTCDTQKGDEDGVDRNMSDKWTPGAPVRLNVIVVGGGVMACWIDWNGSGNLGDNPNKFINIGSVSQAGNVNVVNVTIPNDGSYVTGNPLYVRCRLFPVGQAPGGTLTQDDYVGYAPGGEVEDYRWTFTTTTVTLNELQATTLSTGERLMALLRSWLQR